MFLLYLGISFNTFFFTSILLSSICPWSVCLLTSEYSVMISAYVFITNMVAKIFFVPTNRLTSSQVLRMKSGNKKKWFSSSQRKERKINFQATIASRGYHVYKETTWSNAKVNENVYCNLSIRLSSKSKRQ